MERVILHVDMNNFFASVSCLAHLELAGQPVAVCGDVEKRHGIVLAKNNIAKARGVKTAMTVHEAQRICGGLVCLAPDFAAYKRVSKQAKEICYSYTSQVESFGIDECWMDVTGSVRLFGSGETIANDLRRRIKEEIGITASVGVSFNKCFAKLGSDYKKPDATTVISRENYKDIIWPLPVSDMLYCGKKTADKLHLWGMDTIGALARADEEDLMRLLGKSGQMLWRYANGLDCDPVSERDEIQEVKSIGNGTTAPRDLVSDEDIRIVLRVLSDSVAKRMREAHLKCRGIQLEVRDKYLSVWQRRRMLDTPTNLAKDLLKAAYTLYLEGFAPQLAKRPVRGLTVRVHALVPEDAVGVEQMYFGFSENDRTKDEGLERALDKLRGKFGENSIRTGNLYTDVNLSGVLSDTENDEETEISLDYRRNGKDDIYAARHTGLSRK